MKNLKDSRILKTTMSLILLCILLLSLCTSCTSNQSGGTIDEPDITTDYLRGEYTEQLLRDGAEHIFGTIDIKQEGDETSSPEITVFAKEYVEDSSYPEGFYIADKNKTYITYMPDAARTTYLFEGASAEEILTPDEFVSAVSTDYAAHEDDLSDFRESKLYDIYLMEDQILLILAF